MDNENIPAPRIVRLGGREFRVIDFDRRTIPIHLYLEREMRASGLDKVIPGPEESDDAWAMRLRTQLVDSGRAVDMVAGYIVPLKHPGLSGWWQKLLALFKPRAFQTERDWSPEMAADTAAHIRLCAAADDIGTFDQLALAVALSFFMHAVEQFNRFRSSLPLKGVLNGTPAIPVSRPRPGLH
jgi:hypothetical protein